MSRVYDMKRLVLKLNLTKRKEAVEYFLEMVDMAAEDFEYEFNQTPEEYLYGK